MIDAIRALLRPELAEMAPYVPFDPKGIDVRLDANEAPAPTSEAIHDAVIRAVSAVRLERYPDARAMALKAAISARTGAAPDDLLIGTGSDEVIALLLNALARPRDGLPQGVVLSPTPTFVMYRVTARGHGLKSVEVPLDAAWDLDVGQMSRAIDVMRPSVIFIASPNNPTGNRMSEARLAAVLDVARESICVIDEAYVDYAGESLRSWRSRYPNLVILRTLSKLGLAALRVGWLEGDAALVREIDKGRQPFNVSAISQAAASAVLHEAWDAVRAQTAEVVKERARVAADLVAMGGLAVTPSDANFLWVRTTRPAEEVHGELARRGILVRSFHASGGRLARQLRITIGAHDDSNRLLEALRGMER